MPEFGLKGSTPIREAMYTNNGYKVAHETSTLIDNNKFNFWRCP